MQSTKQQQQELVKYQENSIACFNTVQTQTDETTMVAGRIPNTIDTKHDNELSSAQHNEKKTLRICELETELKKTYTEMEQMRRTAAAMELDFIQFRKPSKSDKRTGSTIQKLTALRSRSHIHTDTDSTGQHKDVKYGDAKPYHNHVAQNESAIISDLRDQLGQESSKMVRLEKMIQDAATSIISDAQTELETNKKKVLDLQNTVDHLTQQLKNALNETKKHKSRAVGRVKIKGKNSKLPTFSFVPKHNEVKKADFSMERARYERTIADLRRKLAAVCLIIIHHYLHLIRII